ncbi:MAG: leucine-rich repeat protein [Ruminococcus sp.]|nr:leucine-rich repeat protein [Ruminococcus sp.]
MKKIKKTMAYLFALICCFSAVTTFSGNYIKNSVVVNAEEEKTFEYWSYVVYDKIDGVCNTPCVEITKFIYQDDLWDAHIPEKINGLPVVSIAGDTFKQNYPKIIYLPSSIKHFGESCKDNLRSSLIMLDNKLEFSVCFDENSSGSDVNKANGLDLSYIYPPDDKDKDDKDIIEDIEIPETIFGLPVKSINSGVFTDNQNIRSVKIPDTVEYFGNMVFKNSSLQSVNIPKSLRIIPSDTFKNCKNLTSVDFHENVIVAHNAFSGTNFKVPNNVKVSEDENRYVHNSYAEITKKSGAFNVKISHENGEYSCEVLSYDPATVSGTMADVIIPEYFFDFPVISINEDFWNECNNAGTDLRSIVFPSGITEIKNLSLDNPQTLKSVTIKAENADIYQNIFKNTSIEEIVLNGSCSIKPMAFMNCKKLKKVEFTGDSPTIDINHDAFRDCTSIEEIIFPDNMTADIKVDAFRNCSAVSELTFNGKVDITSHAFRECNNLKNLTFKGDINLSTDAFSSCSNLTNITIDTNKSITGSAFNGCANLVNINSSPVYNLSAKNFYPEINDFVFNNFNDADDVGFINSYVLEQVDNVIEKYITDDMSDMQKIKTIHDWICNNTVYDFEQTYSEKNHNDASIFMNDSSVCEGYAKCYNLLLNRAGIETYYLIGKEHAWNIIKLGGHYFHSDTTWDDGDDINYNWFLKSDSEALDEDTHSQWTFSTPSTLHNFQKKTLPECKYSMGDLNTDGEINVADLITLNKYLMGQSTISENDIVLADLTYDGVTDIFDMVLMRKLLLNK